MEIEFLMQSLKTGQEGREEGKRNEVSEMKVEKGRGIESERAVKRANRCIYCRNRIVKLSVFTFLAD